MILVDTSGLVANYDRSDHHHEATVRALDEASPPRILSPLVVAEIDYLIHSRLGRQAELDVLHDLASGAFHVPEFDARDIGEASKVLLQYQDLDIGLADASIVILSRKHECLDLLTLDARHFRTVAGAGGKPFRLLPGN